MVCNCNPHRPLPRPCSYSNIGEGGPRGGGVVGNLGLVYQAPKQVLGPLCHLTPYLCLSSSSIFDTLALPPASHSLPTYLVDALAPQPPNTNRYLE